MTREPDTRSVPSASPGTSQPAPDARDADEQFGINFLGELPELEQEDRPPRSVPGRLAARLYRLRWFFDHTGDTTIDSASEPPVTSFATVLFIVVTLGSLTMMTFLFMRGCL